MVGSVRGRFIFILALVVLVSAPSFLLVMILPLCETGCKVENSGRFYVWALWSGMTLFAQPHTAVLQ